MLIVRSILLFIFTLFLLCSCEQGNRLAPVAELKWQTFSHNPKKHSVRHGETLYAIAFRYDIDFRQLAVINHLRPPYVLKVGQTINLQGATRKSPVKSYNYKYKYLNKKQPHHQVHAQVNLRSYPSVSGWQWPVKGQVTANFIPTQGKKGINIACKKGDKIRASAAGLVAYAGSGLNGYGNLLIIKHNNEYLTAYGNNAKNLVKEGQQVKAGEVIADAGVINHKYWGVHFEIRKRGIPVNPLNYLQKG